MLTRLFPRYVDNTYPGYRFALWLLGVILLVKVMISLNCMFNGRTVAVSADGIPLDTFTPACAQMVVADVARWGLAQLMLCLVGIVVLARYRALVPLMFALFLVEHLGRRVILLALPTAVVGTPPGFFVNLLLIAFLTVGLVVSLRNRGTLQPSK